MYILEIKKANDNFVITDTNISYYFIQNQLNIALIIQAFLEELVNKRFLLSFKAKCKAVTIHLLFIKWTKSCPQTSSNIIFRTANCKLVLSYLLHWDFHLVQFRLFPNYIISFTLDTGMVCIFMNYIYTHGHI